MAKKDKLNDAQDALIEARLDKPRPEWIVGTCPECGSELIEIPYFWYGKPGDIRNRADGRRWVLVHQCWNSLGQVERRTCGYQVEEGMTGFESGCHPVPGYGSEDIRD